MTRSFDGLVRGPLALRPWRPSDAAALADIANDKAIWRNLTDAFPHPYTLQDAEDWVAFAQKVEKELHVAIEYEGQLVGGLGANPGTSNHAHVLYLGYWLAQSHWGRGIMGEVVPLVVVPLFQAFPSAKRLEARVLAWNPASARLLEKAGFQLEGRLRDSLWKDGEVVDELVYGVLRSELGPRLR